jgi:hypothetical protein
MKLNNTLFRSLQATKSINNRNVNSQSILFRTNIIRSQNVGSNIAVSSVFSREMHNTQINKVISQLGSFRKFNKRLYYLREPHILNSVYEESGAIKEMPKWLRLGLIKVIINIIIFIFVGSLISKSAVTFLEENDIFKPEDDDDDDDDD